MLSIGIVGLPNVGKSTLFNALTKSHAAAAANYPFCTIDQNIGVVTVPDPRMKKLVELANPKKVIPAAIEFHDIAGLVKGASEGEGLGNQFLAHIRECDAILHLLRHFSGGDIIHVYGTVDAKRDREVVEYELIMADLQTLLKRLEKAKSAARSGDNKAKAYAELLDRVKQALGKGEMLSNIALTDEEKSLLKDLHFLTLKPIIYVMNVSEEELKTFDSGTIKSAVGLSQHHQLIPISAKIEEELGSLSDEEAKEFLASYGLDESGLNKVIRTAYKTLDLITFFTVGPEEVHAWTCPRFAKAPQAAGVIHTDFEKGFIAAEIIGYEDFIRVGSETKAKEVGIMHLEGKEYILQDGDIVHFRFHV